MLSLPALWAFVLALAANFSGFITPEPLSSAIGLVKGITIPLLLVSLGLYFEPVFTKKLLPLVLGVLIRVFGGLLVGFLLAGFFGFQGLDKAVVVLCAAMPAGYNSLVYSAKEGLDDELAAALVSATILVTMAVVLVVFPLL